MPILILNNKSFPDIVNLYAFNKLNPLYKSGVILYCILMFLKFNKTGINAVGKFFILGLKIYTNLNYSYSYYIY